MCEIQGDTQSVILQGMNHLELALGVSSASKKQHLSCVPGYNSQPRPSSHIGSVDFGRGILGMNLRQYFGRGDVFRSQHLKTFGSGKQSIWIGLFSRIFPISGSRFFFSTASLPAFENCGRFVVTPSKR